MPHDPYTAALSMALHVMESRLGGSVFQEGTAADPISSTREVERIQRECEEMGFAIAHSEWEPSLAFRHTKAEFIAALTPLLGRRSAEALR